MSFTQKLVAAGADRVIICHLIYRANESHFQGLEMAEYNARVDQCNIFREKIAVLQKYVC
jgi:hypothetical protein